MPQPEATTRIAFTICCANYLSKAAVLARSLKASCPACAVVLFLIEPTFDSTLPSLDLFDRIILASDLPIASFLPLMFSSTPLEASTSIKASAFRYLFESTCASEIVYLDPDIYVYSDIFSTLSYSRGDIAATPHHLSDEPNDRSISENVFKTLKCGTFNLGFLAIRRSASADAFLSWWEDKLMKFCTVDFDSGLFVDQKWFDIAAAMFDVTPQRHPGLNVANWNLSTRIVYRVDDGVTLVNGSPLIFFHYSKIDTGEDLYFFRRYGNNRDLLLEMRDAYRTLCALEARHLSTSTLWGYASYLSGDMICKKARSLYKKNRILREVFPQPFEATNEILMSYLADDDFPTQRGAR